MGRSSRCRVRPDQEGHVALTALLLHAGPGRLYLMHDWPNDEGAESEDRAMMPLTDDPDYA